MGLFPHTCRPPAWRNARLWTCRCGQEWTVETCRRETADGTVVAVATPVGKPGRKR